VKRTCLFPLRTNAGFYRTQGQLDVKQRIKESVLLYDEIILESGLYIASIGPGGSFDTMGDADADAVDRIRTLKQRGGEFSYSIINDQTGQSTGRTLSAERRLAAEFLSIVDAIRADVGLHKLPDWFRYEGWFDLSRDAKSEVSRAARNDANRRGFWRRKGSHFLRDKVLTNFNYDLRLSAELGALVSMDGYFAPLVARKPEARAVSEGGFALRVLVPNVSALSWNELFELREEPGSVAFRAKLREVEEEAFAAAETLHEAREAVHRRWEWNLSEPWRTRSLSDRLGSILVDQAIGLLPPPMGNVAAAGRSIGDSIGHGHSWGAFFYKLRTKADAQAEPARSEDPAR